MPWVHHGIFMHHKRVFFAAILITMALTVPAFVYSQSGGNKDDIDILNQEIAAKKQKVKQLEESIAAYKKKVESTRLESVSLSNQMAILDNHVVQVELDIEATEQKLDTLELEIKAFTLAIADKEETIARQKVIITEFIRTLHEEGNRNMLEVLAVHESFSDFYNRLQYAKTIEGDLGRNARGLRIVKEELENKRQGTEARKTAYDDLKEELENKRKDLDGQSFAKQQLLAQSHSSEMTYKTLLSNLKSQYQGIENEIMNIEQQVRTKLEKQDKLSGDDVQFGGQISWPTPSRYVTAYFRDPSYPYRHVFEHNAIDIRARQGTALRAAASGYVARTRHCSKSSCYSYIMIVHSGGLSTVYGHMSSINVSTDQFVTRGDVIGYSGGTPGTVGSGPFVTGPHLHFEVRKNGIPVNPLSYLVKDY
jgi:murein DD-endopeptidase MepM/ murein hydrolase activator NlpD